MSTTKPPPTIGSTTLNASSTTDKTTTTSTPSTTSTSTTPTTTPTSTSTAFDSSTTNKEGVRKEVIASACAGGAVFIIVIIVIIVLLLRRRRKRSKPKPPMLPDLREMVNYQVDPAPSTTILIDNDFKELSSGTSADGLPYAPPIPVLDYGPTETYINHGSTLFEDTQPDYPEPSEWAVDTDVEYMPMGITSMGRMVEGEKIQTSSELVQDYAEPNTKPKACVGTANKGYINVPNSIKTQTLPKYANFQTPNNDSEEKTAEEE